MSFNCTHFSSPAGAFSVFLEVVMKFSSASARTVLQRSKGVCKPVNLGYTEEKESTNFPMYLTHCLVQESVLALSSACDTQSISEPPEVHAVGHLYEETQPEATRGLKVLKSDSETTQKRKVNIKKGIKCCKNDKFGFFSHPFLNHKTMVWPCISVEDRSPCVCVQGLVQSLSQGTKRFDIFIPLVLSASARRRQDSLPAAFSSQQTLRGVVPVGWVPLSFELCASPEL